MSDFRQLIVQISERPGMFVGENSLKAVANYLAGYAHALDNSKSLAGWQQWVELKFRICHPAYHWTDILLHAYGADMLALAALPDLYEEFNAQRQRQFSE